MNTISIPREEFERMRYELNVFRKLKLYKRLLEFENNISQDKRYSRKDLGF